MRWRQLLMLAAASLLIITGCTVEQPGIGPVVSTQPTTAEPTEQAPVDLAQRKKEAGIADCPASDPASEAVQTGLPDIVLQCLGGGTPVHLAGLRGKPMMINVWAQWCGPCRQEAPLISEVAMKKQDELLILGIDYADPQPGMAIDFAELSSWQFPQMVDQDSQLKGPLKIVGPPQTFFVRADGRIAYRHIGAFSSAQQIRDLASQYLQVSL